MPRAVRFSNRRPGYEAALRTLAALPLSWLAATLSSAGTASALVAAGVPRTEATVWLMLAGLVVWLALAIYTVATQHLLRAWLVPGALAILGALLVWRIDAGGAL